jgi:hypothetical protein
LLLAFVVNTPLAFEHRANEGLATQSEKATCALVCLHNKSLAKARGEAHGSALGHCCCVTSSRKQHATCALVYTSLAKARGVENALQRQEATCADGCSCWSVGVRSKTNQDQPYTTPSADSTGLAKLTRGEATGLKCTTLGPGQLLVYTNKATGEPLLEAFQRQEANEGGIISPLLSNIYLHDFDVFMTELTNKYTTPLLHLLPPSLVSWPRKKLPGLRMAMPVAYATKREQLFVLTRNELLPLVHLRNEQQMEAHLATCVNNMQPVLWLCKQTQALQRQEGKQMGRVSQPNTRDYFIRNALKKGYNAELSVGHLCKQQELRITPSVIRIGTRVRYNRFADDWIIGITGNKDFAEMIKQEATKFLNEHLKLEVCQKKTKLTNISSDAASYLGFEIRKHDRKYAESPVAVCVNKN